MMLRMLVLVVLVGTLGVGCSSTGNLGIVTKSTASPSALLKSNQSFEELGQAEGSACRHFALGIIPFGKSDVEQAVDKALQGTGGDALLNVSTESSLYGFLPYFNIWAFTCTDVKGTVIKFH